MPPLIIHKYTGIPLVALGVDYRCHYRFLHRECPPMGYIQLWLDRFVWTSSVMIEKTLVFGSLAAKQILVVSEKWDQILFMNSWREGLLC